MLKNYFKIAWRNLARNIRFSLINIFGLAIGIATCLLIMLFVQNELSYDRYNDKADRIVRVVFRGKMNGGGEIKEANVMPPVAQTLKKDFPEVTDATRIRDYGMPRITYGNKTFKEDAFAFVDANFFQIFTIPLIKGNAATALLQPNTAVISKEVAKKYFGNENPIGKVLLFKDQNAALTVTGLIDEVPANSHFHFGVFASMISLPEAKDQIWMASNFFTYLLLQKDYDYRKLEAKLPNEVDKYIGPQLQKSMGVTISQFRKSGNNIGLFLQPLTDIHLHSDLTGDMQPHGDIQYVYIFSAVAVFMLLIACINFMNLSTAGASKRAKEVGIRKVMGSDKKQLITQFFLESFLLTGVAMFIALGLVYLALPVFNNIAGQNLGLQLKNNIWIVPCLVLFSLFTGVLAGSYPAFFLSSFNPINVLKGRFISGKRSTGLRSGLVVFQFFISISLIIGTVIVYKQLSYIQHKKLGYNKDQVIVVEGTYWLGKDQEVFKQQLLQDPRVISVSASGYLPAGNSYGNNFLIYADNNSAQLVNTLRYEVDDNYIPTLSMQLFYGRNFSKQYGTDSLAIIINETAAKTFSWNQNAIGHTLTRQDNYGKKFTYHVIGIVKDFHFKSLHELITPLVMTMSNNDNSNIIIKAKGKDMQGLLSSTKNKWDNLTTQSPFTYSFLDDRYNNTYKAEQNTGLILGIFAGLTIFVACLGLFGLATFIAEQRTKEIGIRKVLGANVASVVSLLSKDFVKLVFIAFLIASPIAWLVMNKWLQYFAYRIQISWWTFFIAAIGALLIALLTISFRAIKAALANPVNSLRSE
ncbi:ABC transporter permease [Mucilaginibacter arboris]|uniref:FtsX-like permease family protein n=1 Tax=Mucilaginibacter arboris TaxID=2682090 RepID=A0A7K1SZB4_9SPHI|nr:ABC transporter permease [Mucilaginibacter arboris]MVN22649.1 FtsX-like permease family protein [Mucilaginibacter arboris]